MENTYEENQYGHIVSFEGVVEKQSKNDQRKRTSFNDRIIVIISFAYKSITWFSITIETNLHVLKQSHPSAFNYLVWLLKSKVLSLEESMGGEKETY